MNTSIPKAPPPWHCKCDFYILPFFQSTSSLPNVPPNLLFSPLEASSSSFTDPHLLKPTGGLSFIWLVRYKESPVGPYDEMIILPGYNQWERVKDEGEGKKGGKEKGENLRISRIYVSQRETCYNGRYNWNIPKHLAKFSFNKNPDGSMKVSIFPHDTHPASATSSASSPETHPAPTPFFTTTFSPFPYIPALPLPLTTLANSFGFPTAFVQPPIPAHEGCESGEVPELCAGPKVGDEETGVHMGEERGEGEGLWCVIDASVWTWKAKGGWFDMRQLSNGTGNRNDAAAGGRRDSGVEVDGGDEGQHGQKYEGFENFWPGMGRWRMGIMLEDAEMVVPKPVTWKHSDAREVN